MKTTLVVAPTATPVTLVEVKAHCVQTSSVDDTLLTRLINVATANVEQILCRKLITQTWKMFLDAWPGEIKLMFGDLQSVTHVKYTDTDETTSTFSTDYYLVDTDSIPGRVVLKYGQSWPSDSLSPKNPIEVQFVTGYGDASTDVPEDIRNAILLLVQHFYENREVVVVGTIAQKIPMAVEALLQPHRVWEWAL